MSISSITSIQGLEAGRAYQQAQQLVQLSPTNEPDNEQQSLSSDPVASFSTVLNNAIEGAINTGKVAETQTAQALAGKGNISDVAADVEEAKLTLHTVTTLRDRFVSAYQEVMRMTV